MPRSAGCENWLGLCWCRKMTVRMLKKVDSPRCDGAYLGRGGKFQAACRLHVQLCSNLHLALYALGFACCSLRESASVTSCNVRGSRMSLKGCGGCYYVFAVYENCKGSPKVQSFPGCNCLTEPRRNTVVNSSTEWGLFKLDENVRDDSKAG